MENVLVIMVGHKARVGKDTFFEAAEKLGFVKCAFATKLKEVVQDLYGFSYDQMHNSEKDLIDKRYINHIGDNYGDFLTPRQILQIFGQDQRKLNPNIWADYVFKRTIPRLVEQGHNKIIITDFRFKNEARVALEWVNSTRGRGLNLIKINRDDVYNSGSEDISEKDLDDFFEWNNILNNNSTIEEYHTKVKTICSVLMKMHDIK